MFFSDRVRLIAPRYTLDAVGNQIAGDSAERTVYADVLSVSQSEFMRASQAGLTPVCKLLVHTGDYKGEREARVNGERLTVYRTFCAGDTTELYLDRKAGDA